MQQLSLFTTSSCQRHCRECIMGPLMRAHPDYHMDLSDLALLLHECEVTGYRLEFILTGGEPLMWRHLPRAVRLLRQSLSCGRLVMFTNGLPATHRLEDVVPFLDEVRISDYGESSVRVNAERLAAQRPGVVRVVDRTRFWTNPSISLTRRVVCLNPEILLFDGRIYACPHSAALGIRHGVPLSQLSVPVAPKFLDEIAAIRQRQAGSVCGFCISNRAVRNRSPHEPN